LDKFQNAFATFDYNVGDEPKEECESFISKPQAEAEALTKYLCDLDAGEMAGYVSSLVVDTPRRADSALESFQKLTHKQQRVVQGALLSLERLVEVQRRSGLDDAIGKCQLELSSCDVVTAWASGASWNDVLAMSGAAPGDLVRTLSRALDALRQIANLPYTPARGFDGTMRLEAIGIHPQIRSLCREAANEMDRYPVKDDLPFQENDREEETEQEQEVDS
jgi:superfamily II RNA helicase